VLRQLDEAAYVIDETPSRSVSLNRVAQIRECFESTLRHTRQLEFAEHNSRNLFSLAGRIMLSEERLQHVKTNERGIREHLQIRKVRTRLAQQY